MSEITKQDRLLYEALKHADWNLHAIPDEELAEIGLTREGVKHRLSDPDFPWAEAPAESERRYIFEEIAPEYGVSAEQIDEWRRRYMQDPSR